MILDVSGNVYLTWLRLLKDTFYDVLLYVRCFFAWLHDAIEVLQGGTAQCVADAVGSSRAWNTDPTDTVLDPCAHRNHFTPVVSLRNDLQEPTGVRVSTQTARRWFQGVVRVCHSRPQGYSALQRLVLVLCELHSQASEGLLSPWSSKMASHSSTQYPETPTCAGNVKLWSVSEVVTQTTDWYNWCSLGLMSVVSWLSLI